MDEKFLSACLSRPSADTSQTSTYSSRWRCEVGYTAVSFVPRLDVLVLLFTISSPSPLYISSIDCLSFFLPASWFSVLTRPLYLPF